MTPDEPTKKRKHGQVGEKAADEGHKTFKKHKYSPYKEDVDFIPSTLNGGPWGGASSHHLSTQVSDGAPTSRQRKGPPKAPPPQFSSPTPSSLATLPPITDPSLAQTPFHHRGIHAKSSTTSSSTSPQPQESYERLEFLGDAYIELIASRLVFTTFPGYPSGKLAQARESLVKNATLAKFSRDYGFDQSVQLPRNFYSTQDPRSRATGKAWEKVLGDVFEAYCAAIVLSYHEDPMAGYAVLEEWLTALWQPTLLLEKQRNCPSVGGGGDGDIGPEATWGSLDLLAKQTLNQKLSGTSTKTSFRDLSPVDTRTLKDEGKEIYHIGCYFTGWGWNDQFLGEGKGLSKKDAGMRAAKEALGNVVAGQIEMVKREFDRRIREERNRERERERKERQGGREGVDGESPTTKVQKQNEGKEDLEQREHT